jgi:hypothetical protein
MTVQSSIEDVKTPSHDMEAEFTSHNQTELIAIANTKACPILMTWEHQKEYQHL